MSACSQSINPMFKLRPLRTCAKFEPVKGLNGNAFCELIAELVEVELQELGFYVMVGVKDASFGIADGNVYPKQDFSDTLFVLRNNGVRKLSPRSFQGRHNCRTRPWPHRPFRPSPHLSCP